MRSLQREEVWDKRVRAIGQFIDALAEGHGAAGLEGGLVTRVTIRCPTPENPEALLVVKATTPGGEFVAFVGGLDIGTAVLTWRAKDGAKGLRWRVDVPWEAR